MSISHECISDVSGADRRCGVCGRGRCRFCNSPSCLRGEEYRPSATRIDGVEVQECGRYLRAGELAATWIELDSTKAGTIRWAICIGCYDRAYAGVNPGRITFGWLKNCLPCGYHTANIEPFRGAATR